MNHMPKIRLSATLASVIASLINNADANPQPDHSVYGPLGFCDVEYDDNVPLVTISDIEATNESTFLISLAFSNWTNSDVNQIIISQNIGGHSDDSPFISNAYIDTDGRPITDIASPPTGNLPKTNNWTVSSINAGANNSRFELNSPQALDDIASPAFLLAGKASGAAGILFSPAWGEGHHTDEECVELITTGFVDPASPFIGPRTLTNPIIPGAVSAGSPAVRIAIPDIETADNGANVLDGFVIEVSNWEPNEQISLNWFLIYSNSSLGLIDNQTGETLGNPYGFGIINFAQISGIAPPPLFNLNTGYDPIDSSDSNQDTPTNWKEDESGGIDNYPINPIPAGEIGAGTFFSIEVGGGVTGQFINAQDGLIPPYNSSSGDVIAGVNLNVNSFPPSVNIPTMGFVWLASLFTVISTIAYRWRKDLGKI